MTPTIIFTTSFFEKGFFLAPLKMPTVPSSHCKHTAMSVPVKTLIILRMRSSLWIVRPKHLFNYTYILIMPVCTVRTIRIDEEVWEYQYTHWLHHATLDTDLIKHEWTNIEKNNFLSLQMWKINEMLVNWFTWSSIIKHSSICVLLPNMLVKRQFWWVCQGWKEFLDCERFAVNGVWRQFTQGKVSTLHLHQGHIELQKNCLHFIFPPKLPSRDQKVSSILKFHKQAFIKQQKGQDSLLGQVISNIPRVVFRFSRENFSYFVHNVFLVME